MRSLAAHGGDGLDLLSWTVGEVGWIGGSHFVRFVQSRAWKCVMSMISVVKRVDCVVLVERARLRYLCTSLTAKTCRCLAWQTGKWQLD